MRRIRVAHDLHTWHWNCMFQINGIFRSGSLRIFCWIGRSTSELLKVQAAVIYPQPRLPLLNLTAWKQLINTGIMKRFSYFHQNLDQLLTESLQLHHQKVMLPRWIWSQRITENVRKQKLKITVKGLTAVRR